MRSLVFQLEISILEILEILRRQKIKEEGLMKFRRGISIYKFCEYDDNSN